MTGFYLLLSFEKPEVDLSRAKEDVIGILIKVQEGQSIFWSVADFIEDGLDADIGSYVPDLDNLVSA